MTQVSAVGRNANIEATPTTTVSQPTTTTTEPPMADVVEEGAGVDLFYAVIVVEEDCREGLVRHVPDVIGSADTTTLSNGGSRQMEQRTWLVRHRFCSSFSLGDYGTFSLIGKDIYLSFDLLFVAGRNRLLYYRLLVCLMTIPCHLCFCCVRVSFSRTYAIWHPRYTLTVFFCLIFFFCSFCFYTALLDLSLWRWILLFI